MLSCRERGLCEQVEVLNRIGMKFTSVGNHVFERARTSCCDCSMAAAGPIRAVARAWARTHRARYQWLSANVFQASTGRALPPPYGIMTFDGMPVAFVGVVQDPGRACRVTVNNFMASGGDAYTRTEGEEPKMSQHSTDDATPPLPPIAVKRRAPPKVAAVTLDGIRYEQAVLPRSEATGQRTGYLAAYKGASDERLWRVRVYDPRRPRDPGHQRERRPFRGRCANPGRVQARLSGAPRYAPQ